MSDSSISNSDCSTNDFENDKISYFSDYNDEEEYSFDTNSIQPYLFEPEKTSENIDESDEEDDEILAESTEFEKNKEHIRVGNLSWCLCGKCVEEKREIDALCCQEIHALTDENFEDKQCITESNEFSLLCLSEIVLENVLISFNQIRGDALETVTSNRALRYASYKQFTWRVHNRLGKGRRRVIPSCVLNRIRTKFPEPNGEYVLYSEGGKD